MEEETSEVIGSSIEQHYIFEGIKEGKTTIKFELKSITDDTINQERKYEVVVDEKLNVTIAEIDS